MNRFKEIKEIAKCNSKIESLLRKMEYDPTEGSADWSTATFVSLDKKRIRRFREHNGETEDYFVEQWSGYLGDDFSGYVYFKTDVPGQYVRVYFEC